MAEAADRRSADRTSWSGDVQAHAWPAQQGTVLPNRALIKRISVQALRPAGIVVNPQSSESTGVLRSFIRSRELAELIGAQRMLVLCACALTSLILILLELLCDSSLFSLSLRHDLLLNLFRALSPITRLSKLSLLAL